MKKIYTSLLFVLFIFQLHATHIVGAEISYKHLSGLDYKVKLILHRDCLGAGLGWSETVNANSVSLSENINFLVAPITNGMLNTVCSPLGTTCTNTTSPYPGYEYYIYEGTVTLPGYASDWVFSYSLCCRNASINNFQSPGLEGIYVSSTLNNSMSAGGFNNSVDFLLDNSALFSINQTCTINQAAIDIDGDSLHYSLVNAMSTSTLTCIYSTGYSGTNPLGNAGSISMNGLSGNMTFNNSITSYNVVAIQVDEYRNGLLIASSTKDMQLVFLNLGANNLPILSGVNGGNNYFTSLNLCIGSTLSFTVNGTDPDLTDSVYVSVTATDITGYTATTNAALQETLTFNWTPGTTDIRPQPYLLVLESKDNSCFTKSTYGYLIYINQCGSDSVWPGDANADYVVNNFDVLNIGIGNGTTGITRPGATTNWAPEFCQNWSNTFLSGINYNNADCNGDGIIDATDMNAVSLNYGQFHLKEENTESHKTEGFPDLYFDVSAALPYAGSTIQLPVMLGTGSALMNDIYGIAGHFKISNSLSAPISFSEHSSWLGNLSNTFLFQKNINDNELAFTLVRNNHTNVNGSGNIGTLSIPVSFFAIPNSALTLHFTDLKLIRNDGSEITDYNVINDTLYILSPKIVQSALFYPNPLQDDLIIKLPSLINQPVTIILTDMLGQVVLERTMLYKPNEALKMNTSLLHKGLYQIRLFSSEGEFRDRLMKW